MAFMLCVIKESQLLPSSPAMVVSQSGNPRQRGLSAIHCQPCRAHQKIGFQEEVREILGKFVVAFDERYLWDLWISRAFSAAPLWGIFPRPRKLSLG